jgi:hypothetical protein
VTQRKQSNLSGEKKARFLRTQQRASMIHSTKPAFHATSEEEAVLTSSISLHI